MYGEKQRSAIRELLADFEKADEIVQNNLFSILQDNADTVYGREHRFADIRSAEAFRHAVPIQDYEPLAPYFDRVYAGEENVLFRYPVAYRVMTSGSSAGRKKLVLTDEALRRFGCYTFFMPYHIMRDDGDGCFFVGTFPKPGPRDITYLSAAFHYHLLKTGWIDDSAFIGGADSVFGADGNGVLYRKAWTALAAENIHDLLTVFLYDMIVLFQFIEKNWKRLLADMEKGRAGSWGGLSPDDPLPRQIPVSRERLSVLRKEFSLGMDDIAVRLWPQLRFVNGIGGKAFFSQEATLRRYIGDLPIVCFSYAATECLLGVPLEPNKSEYALLPQSAYYEFIHCATGEVKAIDELTIGEEYELVITTFTGLYRYRLGDILRVCRFCGKTPVVAVTGRALTSNVAGEKVNIRRFDELASRSLAAVGEPNAEHSIGVDTAVYPNSYVMFYEADGADRAEELSRLIDEGLCDENHDYAELRKEGVLAAAKAMPIRHGGHRECVYALNGAAHKKPIVRLNSKQIEFLKGYRLDE